MWVWSLGWEDPLEKEMVTHSIILASETTWTKEPGGLQPMGLQRVRHYLAIKQQQQQQIYIYIYPIGNWFTNFTTLQKCVMLHLLVKGLVCQFSKLLIFSSLFEYCRPLSVHVWNVVDFLLGIWVLEFCILLKIMTTLTYWNCFNCYFVNILSDTAVKNSSLYFFF